MGLGVLAGQTLPTARSLPATLVAPRATTTWAESPPSDRTGPDDDAIAPPPTREYLALLRAREQAADRALARIDDAALPLPEGTHLVFHVDAPDADASVVAHAEDIDAISPDWFRVRGADCTVEVMPGAGHEPSPSHALLLPRVANLDGDRWTSAETSTLLADDDARACVASTLAAELIERGADGVNLDLEALAPEDASGVVQLLVELREALHPAGLRVTIDVAAGDPAFDLARIDRVADAVVLMAYDQHHADGAPGPIAARAWLGQQVDTALAAVDRERLVVALGGYCYDWPRSGAATSRTLDEAWILAARHGLRPRTVAETGNLAFAYDGDAGEHRVWCLDAAAGADALASLDARGLHRTALWRAGTEDTQWWPVLRAATPEGRAVALRQLPAPAGVVTQGRGDVIVRQAERRSGRRVVELDTAGFVRSAELEPPHPTLLQRVGDTEGAGVVLTFDDGPDPIWTPALLDALAELRAPASFFVVGEQALAHPELVRRAAADGHVIASHSWSHPDMAALPRADADGELERTARLLEALLGHGVLFYRAPFTASFDDADADRVEQHAAAFDHGYAYVAASVDPADWDHADADAIVARVLAQVDDGGRVVVLHDGGGDRGATVEAVRRLVPELARRGHPIIGLEQYLGHGAAALAPALPLPHAVIGVANGVWSSLYAGGAAVLPWLFAICTALAAARIVALAVLVLRRPPARRHDAPPRRPLVSVLLPSFNEAAVIESSVRSLLAGDYGELEVVVIDDGSTDDTSAIALRLAREDHRVRCLRKPNGGKASAANLGIAAARGEIIVAVDADTQIAADAIARMVAHFDDPEVVAVCGNVEVGNVCSALTAFQAIEYITSQNFDRRAFAALNCIGVVPGALGAWRRSAVQAVGGYSHDTLVEDADLTLTVLRSGGRITYEPRAVGRTEAPLSLGALWKQRFRWTYGTYQCLAKHRGALLRGTLGWVALPNVLLFQVLFPLVSPIGDAALLLALATGSWSAVLSGYLGFLAMDLLASVLAFALDRKPMRWLPLLLIQRFTYRQFLYLVSLRAMIAVLAGGRHGWRKLERTATVIPLGAPQTATFDRAA